MVNKNHIAITTIVLVLIINSFNLTYENNNLTNDNNILDRQFTTDFVERSEQKINNESYNTLSSQSRAGIFENQPRGGSWVDEFEDLNSVESKSNLVFVEDKILNNNYFRQDSSFSNFSDSFEGSDGLSIDSYDSKYKKYSTVPSGTWNAEIDTAEYYIGTSSLKLYASGAQRTVMVNKSVNYTEPVLEFSYYIRLFCSGASSGSANCAYNLRLYSGNNLITSFGIYGPGDIRFIDGSAHAYAGKSISHSIWYKFRVVMYKKNNNYSHYELTVWNVNDFQNPFFSKTGIKVQNKGCSLIDKLSLAISNVWEPSTNGWFDGLDIVQTGFDNVSTLKSKPINLPPGTAWDSAYMNKIEPFNSTIELRILNATNDQIIHGPITNYESSIWNKFEANIYRSIKLHATFKTHGNVTPKLFGWGVSWNATNTWRDSLFGGLKAEKLNLTRFNGEIWQNASTTEFYRYSGNPILPNGPSSSWDEKQVSRFWIIYNGIEYMMWYTGLDASDKWEIGLATSSDGISWTKHSGNPVLNVGGAGSWESDNVGRPTVIFNGTEYKMFYQGLATLYPKIGFATSSDGINWNKYQHNPVLDKGAAGSWDERGVNCPTIYYDGVSYKLWFSGVTNPHNSKIGYASSFDGIRWTKYLFNPIITGLPNALQGSANLHVIPSGNQYLGWYNYDYGSYDEIYHAYSNDEVNWIKSSANPILTKDPTSSWDSDSVQSPLIMFKDKQYYLYYTGRSGSVAQIGLAKSKFIQKGILTSKPIPVPFNCYYDKITINKAEPSGTYINISILDGTTDQVISSFKDITANEIDISGFSPIQYPSIKLQATFESNGLDTPILFDWSVNWTLNKPPMILELSTPPAVNRTFTARITMNLTDHEDAEYNLTPIIKYSPPNDNQWYSKYLSNLTFSNDHWECDFRPAIDAILGDYEFRFNCMDSYQLLNPNPLTKFIEVRNNNPIIQELFTEPFNGNVNRTKTMKIIINATDIENSSNELKIEIKYKSPLDTNWQDEYISSKISYTGPYWVGEFKPLKDAVFGQYLLNISCTDDASTVYKYLNIQVNNNKPTLLIEIEPDSPRTKDDLNAKIIYSKDVETNNLIYWYHWFKNNTFMPEFDNSSKIPENLTTKNDTWRCEVHPFDGDELGVPDVDEVIIQNTPPRVEFAFAENFSFIKMLEDTPRSLEDLLYKLFTDDDGDRLVFSVTGQENVSIGITQKNGTIKLIPEANWFGTELVTFYADDTYSTPAHFSIEVIVNPTNDLPEIVRVGEKYTIEGYPELMFNVDEDKWLNLTILVEDIDGDVERNMIEYNINRTQTSSFYLLFNNLKFYPQNKDVGWHYITISITDNNETPVQFISQRIKISVKNVNDPPSVIISAPVDGGEFFENQGITFDGIAEDIDLLVWNSQEKLSFEWSTNKTEYKLLGTEQKLINLSYLPPGEYTIYLTVTDTSNVSDSDFVQIIIKPADKDDKTQSIISYYLWLWILIFIIALILGVLLYTYKKKKKRELATAGVSPGEVLLPDAEYRPSLGVAGVSQGAQLSQPIVMQSTPLASAETQQILAPAPGATAAAESQPQLPPAQPTGFKPRFSPEQKLELLEQRLLKGEIDEDVYLELKAKYEFEAGPYQPPPQLPPASIPTPTIETPESTTATPLETVEPSTEVPPTTIAPPAETELEPTPPVPGDLPNDAYQIPPPTSHPPVQPTTQPTQPQPIEQPQEQQAPIKDKSQTQNDESMEK